MPVRHRRRLGRPHPPWPWASAIGSSRRERGPVPRQHYQPAKPRDRPSRGLGARPRCDADGDHRWFLDSRSISRSTTSFSAYLVEKARRCRQLAVVPYPPCRSPIPLAKSYRDCRRRRGTLPLAKLVRLARVLQFATPLAYRTTTIENLLSSSSYKVRLMKLDAVGTSTNLHG
jgi:hypothetical protein